MDPTMDLKRRQAIENTVVLLIISKQNTHHKNINDHITSPYGREILDEVHEIERIGVKIKRRETCTPH
jgi:hypothetical protein